MGKKTLGLFLGPLLFAAIMLGVRPSGLSNAGVSVLASTVWIAIWWILEVVPIAVTALIPIILFPLLGVMDLSETTRSFGHKYIFLYIGGFVLAIAMERWNLHKRIAIHIIYLIGTNVRMIILGFMLATAFLSMWVSNTATSVMMLPIALAIIYQLRDNPNTTENENQIFGKSLLLAVAYSASIGGVATLIGSPVNLIFLGIVQETYGVEITFAQWFVIGLPISAVLLVICWKYLTGIAFRTGADAFPGGRTEIKKQLEALGPVSIQEKAVFAVFTLTAVAWITRSFFLNALLPGIDDPIIGVAAAVALFLIPANRERTRSLVTWEEAVKLPWGVLLLFGGGLAIAEGFKTSGLAVWIGQQMGALQGAYLIVLIVVVVAAVNFLTEITSNLATVAMILPILAPLALTIDVHPYMLMVGATIAASCAFMLPVATPPNAVVFGAGYLRVSDMALTGLWMNLLSIALLSIAVYLLLPLMWGFDPNFFPMVFK